MTSLMQQFAEARKQRQLEQQNRNQATANLLFQAKSDRQQLAAQIQIEADLYHTQRSANEQNRRQIAKADRSLRNFENQQRLITARLNARQRQQEIVERKRYVGDRLQEFQAQQKTTAKILKQQFRELKAQLEALRQARLFQAEVNTQARLAELIVRVANVRLQMALIHQNRIVTENRDRQARIEFRQENINDTAQLMQQIRNEIYELRLYVWGDCASATFEAPTKPNLIQVSDVNPNPEVLTELILDPIEVEIAFTNLVNPDLNSGEIEKFIVSYVSQLENPVPLSQLVSDRDAVKSLLAQGSSELKIDPSEVLNVLLKMVETK
jgi:hypothetical protein